MCVSFVFSNSSITFEGDNIMPQLQSQVLSISKSLLCPRKSSVLVTAVLGCNLTRPGTTKTQQLGTPESSSGWEGHTEAFAPTSLSHLLLVSEPTSKVSPPHWSRRDTQITGLSTVWLARPQSLTSSRTNPL